MYEFQQILKVGKRILRPHGIRIKQKEPENIPQNALSVQNALIRVFDEHPNAVVFISIDYLRGGAHWSCIKRTASTHKMVTIDGVRHDLTFQRD